MSATRDKLYEQLGHVDGYSKATMQHEAWVVSLIRGEARLAGAQVRLEWVDPKPEWVDDWVASRSPVTA
jgi:hypothetical protein